MTKTGSWGSSVLRLCRLVPCKYSRRPRSRARARVYAPRAQTTAEKKRKKTGQDSLGAEYRPPISFDRTAETKSAVVTSLTRSNSDSRQPAALRLALPSAAPSALFLSLASPPTPTPTLKATRGMTSFFSRNQNLKAFVPLSPLSPIFRSLACPVPMCHGSFRERERVLAYSGGCSYYAFLTLLEASLSGTRNLLVLPPTSTLLKRFHGWTWLDQSSIISAMSGGSFHSSAFGFYLESERAPSTLVRWCFALVRWLASRATRSVQGRGGVASAATAGDFARNRGKRAGLTTPLLLWVGQGQRGQGRSHAKRKGHRALRSE